MKTGTHLRALCWMLALACASPAAGAGQPGRHAVSASGIPAFEEAMLSPDFWIRRLPDPDAVLLDAGQAAAKRALVYAPGGGFVDLQRVPSSFTRAQVADWIKQAGQSPVKIAVDEHGKPVAAAALAAVRRNTALDRVVATTPARYGLSVRRAHLRTLPTQRNFYAAADQRDYESLQAGILLPGEAVVIVHPSADRRWLLVMSSQGPAWARSEDIAEGPRSKVFEYAARPPGRVVTGDQVRTVFTPEAPEVSELLLDMGTALPQAEVPAGEPVNGASAYASWALLLPVRGQGGALSFKPALLRRSADTAPDYLPLTRANIIRQSFKFLGERYGWGHQFNARDCSGLTGEVYRSMGVLLPPNSGLQGSSTAFRHRRFTDRDSHADRVQALKEAQVGDLVVVPGHVLMIIGHVEGEPYVIQDVPYAVFKDPRTGALRKTKLNQVSVTPLLPLYADDKTLYVDAMTSLVRVSGQ